LDPECIWLGNRLLFLYIKSNLNLSMVRHKSVPWYMNCNSLTLYIHTWYRRPSLFEVLVLTALTICRLFFKNRFHYPRIFSFIIRGFKDENTDKFQILLNLIEHWTRWSNHNNIKLFSAGKITIFILCNFPLSSAVLIFAGNLRNVTPTNNEDRLYFKSMFKKK